MTATAELVDTKRSLLLGCGRDRRKKVALDDCRDWVGALTTLDMSPDVGADVVWDLEERPLPFEDETFDEIGCFDVLEHVGRQGDWRGWFDEMSEYHRILKPGGRFLALVPIGGDALADPGHTRMFHQNHFGFLTREFYDDNFAKGAPVTDYRWYITRWWTIECIFQTEGHHIAVSLRKV